MPAWFSNKVPFSESNIIKSFNYITQPHTFLHVIPRICSSLIVRRIAGTKITPNQITIFRAVFNLLALVFFIAGDYMSLILAFCAFQFNEILDHVDGDLARFKNIRSRKGLFLEYLVDVPGSTIYGLFGLSVTIGIYRTSHNINIFFIFIAGLIAFALNETYAKAFSLRDNKRGLQQAEYSRYIKLGELGIINKKIINVLYAFYMWRNQLILWAALLFWPVQKYLHFNPLFWSMVLIALVSQMQWIRTVYIGYKKSTADS